MSIGHSQQEENMRRIQSVGGVITSVTYWGKKSDVMLRVYTQIYMRLMHGFAHF